MKTSHFCNGTWLPAERLALDSACLMVFVYHGFTFLVWPSNHFIFFLKLFVKPTFITVQMKTNALILVSYDDTYRAPFSLCFYTHFAFFDFVFLVSKVTSSVTKGFWQCLPKVWWKFGFFPFIGLPSSLKWRLNWTFYVLFFFYQVSEVGQGLSICLGYWGDQTGDWGDQTFGIVSWISHDHGKGWLEVEVGCLTAFLFIRSEVSQKWVRNQLSDSWTASECDFEQSVKVAWTPSPTTPCCYWI